MGGEQLPGEPQAPDLQGRLGRVLRPKTIQTTVRAVYRPSASVLPAQRVLRENQQTPTPPPAGGLNGSASSSCSGCSSLGSQVLGETGSSLFLSPNSAGIRARPSA